MRKSKKKRQAKGEPKIATTLFAERLSRGRSVRSSRRRATNCPQQHCIGLDGPPLRAAGAATQIGRGARKKSKKKRQQGEPRRGARKKSKKKRQQGAPKIATTTEEGQAAHQQSVKPSNPDAV